MNTLDVQLDTLDEQLQSYSRVQRWAIYLLSALGIVAMGWLFYLSDALDELSTLQEQNRQLAQRISENSPEAYQAKILQTSRQIAAEENRIRVLESDKEALLLQMGANGGLLFDNRRYARILDQLLERSVRLGLNVELMESEDLDQPYYGKISRYKRLTVSGTGSFPAFADFLSFVEAQNALVQIESVEIRSDEAKPRFVAVISFMGVAL